MIAGKLQIDAVTGKLWENGIAGNLSGGIFAGRLVFFDAFQNMEIFYASNGDFYDANGNEILVWRE